MIVGLGKMDLAELEKQFKPNVTPAKMFKEGSFGGTYWRPIYSSVTKKKYKNEHLKFPKSWWKGLDEDKVLVSEKCDKSVNKYGVNVGTSLDFWEDKGWITKYDPYGWVQWYCNYKMGRRCPDDERQIKRWLQLAGPRGRFRLWLITQIQKKGGSGSGSGSGGVGSYNDYKISPKIRQTLLHWGYELTKDDYEKEVALRAKKGK